MKNQRPIFIVGCPRSGAGIITEILNVLGAEVGEVNRAMEHIEIHNRVISPFLSFNKMDPNGQFPIPFFRPEWVTEKAISLFRHKIGTYLMPYPFAYKDSRLLLIHPVIDMAFPGARWIIIRRDVEDIVQSCEKTGYMTAFADAGIREQIGVATEKEGWEWWHGKYEYMLNELKNAGVCYNEIWPTKLARKEYTEIKNVCEMLGLKWDIKQVRHLLKKLKEEKQQWQ